MLLIAIILVFLLLIKINIMDLNRGWNEISGGIIAVRIIFLSLTTVISFVDKNYKFLFFSELNQILLKVKGNGIVKIFNSNFIYKPSKYYLNNDTSPRIIYSSSIELPNTENEIKLIFENIITSIQCSLNVPIF